MSSGLVWGSARGLEKSGGGKGEGQGEEGVCFSGSLCGLTSSQSLREDGMVRWIAGGERQHTLIFVTLFLHQVHNTSHNLTAYRYSMPTLEHNSCTFWASQLIWGAESFMSSRWGNASLTLA